MEIPLAACLLQFIAMSEGIRMHCLVSHCIKIIEIKLDLADSILIVPIDSEHIVIHQAVSYHDELSVAIFN